MWEQWWHLIPGEPGGIVIDVLESDDGRGSAGQAISRHVRHLQGQVIDGDHLGMTVWGWETERAQDQVRSGPPVGSVDTGEPCGWLQVPCLLPSSGEGCAACLSGSNGSAVNPRLRPALEWVEVSYQPEKHLQSTCCVLGAEEHCELGPCHSRERDGLRIT